MKNFKISDFKITSGANFNIKNFKTTMPHFYKDKDDYKKTLKKIKKENNELQDILYAHDKYSFLLIFQAMDAAGKDSTIKHVLSGMNPIGISCSSFKRPSELELDHDFLWRTTKELPRRGHIKVFNRSYYEEVLVVKVHKDILTKYQKLPAENISNLTTTWKNRYKSIKDFESHLNSNGTKTIKFFLNISKKEQKKRFLRRIDLKEKNWKFSSGDLVERKLWTQYTKAYSEAIKHTATPNSPWYVIPADDKPNMRLVIAKIINSHLKKLPIQYPKLNAKDFSELRQSRLQLNKGIN